MVEYINSYKSSEGNISTAARVYKNVSISNDYTNKIHDIFHVSYGVYVSLSDQTLTASSCTINVVYTRNSLSGGVNTLSIVDDMNTFSVQGNIGRQVIRLDWKDVYGNVVFNTYLIGEDMGYYGYRIAYHARGGTGTTLYSMAIGTNSYSGNVDLRPCGYTKEGYSFNGWEWSGWDSAVMGIIYPGGSLDAPADQLYTVYADWTVNKYTITFKNYDGTILQESNVEYGTTPVYSGNTPEKASTNTSNYSFSGWSPVISTVTGDQQYTAAFTETVRKYIVKFKYPDKTTSQIEAEYGVPFNLPTVSDNIPDSIYPEEDFTVDSNVYSQTKTIKKWVWQLGSLYHEQGSEFVVESDAEITFTAAESIDHKEYRYAVVIIYKSDTGSVIEKALHTTGWSPTPSGEVTNITLRSLSKTGYTSKWVVNKNVRI